MKVALGLPFLLFYNCNDTLCSAYFIQSGKRIREQEKLFLGLMNAFRIEVCFQNERFVNISKHTDIQHSGLSQVNFFISKNSTPPPFHEILRFKLKLIEKKKKKVCRFMNNIQCNVPTDKNSSKFSQPGRCLNIHLLNPAFPAPSKLPATAPFAVNLFTPPTRLSRVSP